LTKEGLTFGDEKKKLKAKQEEVCSSMRVTWHDVNVDSRLQ
jgi:hypothetical protein